MAGWEWCASDMEKKPSCGASRRVILCYDTSAEWELVVRCPRTDEDVKSARGTRVAVVIVNPLSPERLAEIRHALDLSQEKMARLLGVSFVSVNRWEGGKSAPSPALMDLYQALDAALVKDTPPHLLRQAALQKRPLFLLRLFTLAYASEAPEWEEELR